MQIKKSAQLVFAKRNSTVGASSEHVVLDSPEHVTTPNDSGLPGVRDRSKYGTCHAIQLQNCALAGIRVLIWRGRGFWSVGARSSPGLAQNSAPATWLQLRSCRSLHNRRFGLAGARGAQDRSK